MWTYEALVHWASGCKLPVKILEAVDSTNAWLKRHQPEKPLLVIAYAQTAGYGQRGRQWHMRPGCDLVFSFWLPDASHLATCSMLTPYVALRLRAFLQPFSDEMIRCKWPNDLYHLHGKISGTLIEREKRGLLVGTGINWVASTERKNAVTGTELPWAFLSAWGQWGLTQLPDFCPAHWHDVMPQWQALDWFTRGAQLQDETGKRYRYGGIQADGSVLLWQGRRKLKTYGGVSLRLVDHDESGHWQ